MLAIRERIRYSIKTYLQCNKGRIRYAKRAGIRYAIKYIKPRLKISAFFVAILQ